ncbi:MAG: RluA family pseudouridine synthase [Solobacterium sp.]|nr:RluA family pseudouridine synthase [Solobacterium sp.]
MKVLYEDNHLLGVEKPCNMPVQEDDSKDLDLLRACKEYIKEKYQKPGNVYIGLIHRLDRPVGGCMVFARTSKAASRLSDMMRKNEIEKIYYAVIEGKPKENGGTLIDYLTKNAKTNTVTVTDETQGKKSILHYELMDSKNNLSLLRIHLETGRPHQIRVQLSSRGMPIVNDQRYNKNAKKGQIALHCTNLRFKHPVKKEEVLLTSSLPNRWPWTEFEVM